MTLLRRTNMLPPKDEMNKLLRERESRFRDDIEPDPSAQHPEFGPPDFGDEEDEIGEYADRDEIADSYSRFSELEQPYPDDEPASQHEEDGEQKEYGFTPPPSAAGIRTEPVEPESLREDGGSFLRDDVLFPGGPTHSQVSAWKKQFEVDGHHVMLSEIGDEVFIWRTLNRVEYREVMALPNTDPLQREEILCEICTLYPPNYNFTEMASRRAGVPAVLAEQLMKESGFTQPTPPIRL